MTKSPRNDPRLNAESADDIFAEALRSVEKYQRRKAEEGQHAVDLEETIESIVVPEELAGEGEDPFEVPIADIVKSLDAPEAVSPPPPVAPPQTHRRPEPSISEAAQGLIDRLKTRTSDLTKDVQRLETQLAEKTAEAQKSHERAVWLQAELENTKKRHAREKADIERYGSEKFAREVLPVLDNLERALLHAKDSPEFHVLNEGVQMTLTQFSNCLRRLGVTRIELKPGMPFDPAVHEAMMQEESELPQNSVVREMQAGYLLQDRLLRASLVTVARPLTRPSTPETAAEGGEAAEAAPESPAAASGEDALEESPASGEEQA